VSSSFGCAQNLPAQREEQIYLVRFGHIFENTVHNLFRSVLPKEEEEEEEEGSSNSRFKRQNFADDENATTPSFQIYCEAL
jgi:hypothetical protein